MTNEMIGYWLIGAVVVFVLLKRWWTAGDWKVRSPVTLYEATGIFRPVEIFRPVTIIPKKPRKAGWLVFIIGMAILWAVFGR